MPSHTTDKCYAGLDVSLKETAVCIVNEAQQNHLRAHCPDRPAGDLGQASRLEMRLDRRGPQDCHHTARHLARWNIL